MNHRTVTDLTSALQDGSVSSTELVSDAIARIETGDERLNAVVVRDFERARDAAAEADAALARGERRPLLGVPMTVKEAFNVGGLVTTWGLPGVEPTPATEDAVAVARLKTAGAIILGKTNIPVMLGDWQSFNPVYGVTANPWDLARTAGGSSGGSAAALAAGYVPLELGTDLAGSLRSPAHCCGVYAHKPTHGIVPMRGCAPPGTPVQAIAAGIDLAVAGPMARSADDLALALEVLAGPDEADAVAYALRLPPPRHRRLRDYRVLVIDEHPLLPTERGIRSALDSFADSLREAGCTVSGLHAEVPDLAAIGQLYARLLMAFIGADVPESDYRQAASANDAMALSHREWIHDDRTRHAFANQWHALFKTWDVVVCPSMPTVAFAHDHRAMNERELLVDGLPVAYSSQYLWASLATLTGQPATAMPIAIGDHGLPIGVQAIGPRLEDRSTIEFARLCEREFGGFTPPPGW